MEYPHATATSYIRSLGYEVIPPNDSGEVTLRARDGRFMTFPDIPSFSRFSRNVRRSVENHLHAEAREFAKVVIENCIGCAGEES